MLSRFTMIYGEHFQNQNDITQRTVGAKFNNNIFIFCSFVVVVVEVVLILTPRPFRRNSLCPRCLLFWWSNKLVVAS
jgi:hypothetical protein